MRFHPDGPEAGGRVELAIDSPRSIRDVVKMLCIPDNQPLMIIHNGDLVQADALTDTYVGADDTLSLVPPIQAG